MLLFSLLFRKAKAQTEYIVTVNQNDGTISKIDSIPGIVYLQLNSATYNQFSKEYIVIGTKDPSQSPVYLYTLDAISGNVLFNPVLQDANKFMGIRCSRLTGKIYGIINDGGVYRLVLINKLSGTYSNITDIPGISAVGDIVIDEIHQLLYLRAVDNNPSFAIITINLNTGNILSHVPTQRVFNFTFDNISNKIFALAGRPGSTPGNTIISICTVDPVSGTYVDIADLPNVENILSSDHQTFDENDHIYLFAGKELQTPGIFLYSIDATNGNIINKVHTPASGGIGADNLIFFRYDNNFNKLYALFWEAHTIKPPPPVIDSSCDLILATKIYPNPSNHILIINKNPTVCKVFMNMYNMIGQMTIRSKIINDGLNKIQLSNLSSGIYYYELISDGKVFLKGRFLKQ